jgi:magnesium chelatase family protein
MMDRFDLIIEVPEISAGILLKEASGESSQIVATRVAAARQFGARRNQGVMRANAQIGIDQLDQQIIMDDAAQDLLRTAMDQANLSARAYHKIMRVSRTIADLAGDDRVGRAALAKPWLIARCRCLHRFGVCAQSHPMSALQYQCLTNAGFRECRLAKLH